MVQDIFDSLCTDSPSTQEKTWGEGGDCTQANFWLLHITMRGETEKTQRWDMIQKYSAT